MTADAKRSRGRPLTVPEARTVRMPAGTIDRIGSRLNDGEKIGQYLLRAVLAQIERDEAK